MIQGLSDPYIVVQNEVMLIEPNSFESTLGRGEREVKAQTNGVVTEAVFYENNETKIGKMKWIAKSTAVNLELIDRLKQIPNPIPVTAVFGNLATAGFTAVMVNDVMPKAGTDGKLEVNFEGDPILLTLSNN